MIDLDHLHHGLGYLLASVAVLAAAPLCYRLLRGAPRVLGVLDLVVGLATLGLVGLLVLPECVELAGTAALAAAGVGLTIPLLAERRVRAIAHGAAPWLAAAALALHAATDGVAIAGAHAHHHGHGHGLELAVVLHRLLDGLGVWWLLRPHGKHIALAGLALVASTTILGFALASAVLPVVEATHGVLFQAFVCGLLLHVLLHRPLGRAVDGVLPWAVSSLLGLAAVVQLAGGGLSALPTVLALLGLALVLVLPHWPGRRHAVPPAI